MKAIGDETTKEWWKLTDPMQEPLTTRKEGEWWAEMEMLINTGEKTVPSPETKSGRVPGNGVGETGS